MLPSFSVSTTEQASPAYLPPSSVNPDQLIPVAPESIDETGLASATVEQLILKTLYFRGDLVGSELARSVGLKFSVIEGFLETLKRQSLVQVRRSLGIGNMSSYFALTEVGRSHARDYLESCQYSGPAPVPLYQYTYFVRRQRPADGWLTADALARAYRRMVVTPKILAQIGPAVSSGNSFLIYGEPGNGKTYLAEALANLDKSCIYMPYAVEHQGAIIQIYDPTYHQIVNDEGPALCITTDMPHDGRWFKCRRPFIVTGGELTLDMLDLSYNETSKVYDAPFQLKANNGIYLIDDFGRQRTTPAEVLNRWIVPMERRVDYLSLRTGGKVTVPFESFLVFSTNLKPQELGDEAFLRRIQYKMYMPNPSEQEFQQIFLNFCDSRELPCPDGLVGRLVEKHYRKSRKKFRRCHPRDILSHAIDIIHFEHLAYEITEDLLDRAFESCFVSDDNEG